MDHFGEYVIPGDHEETVEEYHCGLSRMDSEAGEVSFSTTYSLDTQAGNSNCPGKYHRPKELGRMENVDWVINLATEGAPCIAPVKELSKILDVGTGGGIWCLSVAEERQ